MWLARSPGLYTAAVSSWTPASLGAALIAWYKADVGVYKDAGTTLAANNETVQQWNDQSGNNYHLSQGTGVFRPTYKTGTLNSLPILDFNGVNFILTSSQPVSLGGTVLSVFFVRKITATVLNGRVIGISTPGSSDIGTDTAILEYTPGTSITTPTSYNAGNKSNGTITTSTWNEIGTIWDGVTNTMYINNSAQTGVANTPTFASSVDLEVFSNGGNIPTGQIAEIVICKAALSSTERDNLSTYFMNKWGV
jgi:hypothetical protein